MLFGEAKLNDEPAPHQRLVFITTSSCWGVRQAALGEGRMVGTEQSSDQASDKLQESEWGLLFVLIAGSSPGDCLSSCWDRRPYCSVLLFTAVPIFGRKLQDKTLTFFFLALWVCSQGAHPSAWLFKLSLPPEEVQLPLPSWAEPHRLHPKILAGTWKLFIELR